MLNYQRVNIAELETPGRIGATVKFTYADPIGIPTYNTHDFIPHFNLFQ